MLFIVLSSKDRQSVSRTIVTVGSNWVVVIGRITPNVDDVFPARHGERAGEIKRKRFRMSINACDNEIARFYH